MIYNHFNDSNYAYVYMYKSMYVKNMEIKQIYMQVVVGLER